MHELLWRLDCLQSLGYEQATALFKEQEERFASVHGQLDQLLDLEPGPELLGALVRLQSAELDCSAQVQIATLWARITGWVEAQSVASVAASLASGNVQSDRLIGAEIATAMNISQRSAENRIGFVHQATESLQPAMHAMSAGQLTPGHVRSLAEATRVCDDDIACIVADRVVPKAIARGWTPPELKAAAERCIRSLDPAGAAKRHKKAMESSDVQVYGDSNDMASVVATTSAPVARQIMDTLDRRARELQRAGDERTIGQLRVSALARAVLGEESKRPAAEVVVTIDLPTLLGLASNPGELVGYGPINADLARQIAADATLRRLVTDPITGMTLDLGLNRYRPSALLRRLLIARDRTCRFPGCTRPAQRCDDDHVINHDAGGATCTDNMHPLCRMHHIFKTIKAWRLQRHANGTTIWTSLLGFTYVKRAATHPYDGLDRSPPRRPADVVFEPGARMPLEQRLATVIELHDASGSPGRDRRRCAPGEQSSAA